MSTASRPLIRMTDALCTELRISPLWPVSHTKIMSLGLKKRDAHVPTALCFGFLPGYRDPGITQGRACDRGIGLPGGWCMAHVPRDWWV